MKRLAPPSPTASLERNPIPHPNFRSGIYQAARSGFDLVVRHAGIELRCAGITHQGRRPNNEDAIGFAVGTDKRGRDLACFLLLDGLGGHQAGEIASRYAALHVLKIVVESRSAHLPGKFVLQQAIREASHALLELSKVKPETYDMGTTIVAILMLQGEVHAAHAGDSRLYRRLAGRRLFRVTKDHSLMNALGPDCSVNAEPHDLGLLQPGAKYLLCSDGLTVPAGEIESLLDQNPPRKACEALVRSAIDAHGSKDNTSVILVKARR